MKLKLVFGGDERFIDFSEPAVLSDLLKIHGERIDMPCGGRRSCGKCRVKFSGQAIPMDPAEMELLGSEEASQGIRLACMTTVTGDGIVYINQNKKDKIQLEGKHNVFETDGRNGYGAAFDIGTTTVAAYLCDLNTGEILAVSSGKNVQASYGADVISRIDKAVHGELDRLSSAIRGQINELLEQICRKVGIGTFDVESVVITGNTTMQYLVCGLMPASLAAAPFKADELFGKNYRAGEIGLSTDAKVYITPSISAFVGGDITSGILSTALCDYNEPVILADIGTNGEIVLFNDGELLSCSTAAGPAFEGAGIYMGMNGAEGAVSHVKLRKGIPCCEVIGDVEASGICGSGVIDAAAVFLELGSIDETGHIDEESEYACEISDQTALKLPGTDVLLTQRDVRAIQLAKSAVCSGIMTLMHEAGLKTEDIGRLIIAGGFGTVLDVECAEKIGLIPEGFAKKSIAVGNAAGMGAIEMLLSEKTRETAEIIAKRAVNVDLNGSKIFNELYIENMTFGEI